MTEILPFLCCMLCSSRPCMKINLLAESHEYYYIFILCLSSWKPCYMYEYTLWGWDKAHNSLGPCNCSPYSRNFASPNAANSQYCRDCGKHVSGSHNTVVTTMNLTNIVTSIYLTTVLTNTYLNTCDNYRS